MRADVVIDQRKPANDWAEDQIDRLSPVPLYYQLQELLKRELDGGRWTPGDLLPSEAEFAAMLGISRTVIRKALDVLEGDGQIYRVKGKGTIVSPRRSRYEAIATGRDWYQNETGAIPRILKVVHAAEIQVAGHLSKLLQLSPGANAWEIVTVNALADEPVSLSQMFIRADASKRLKNVGTATEILAEEGPQALEQLTSVWGIDISETNLDLQQTTANDFEADEMRIAPGSPLLLSSLVAIDAAQRPVVFDRTVIRSDRFHLSLRIPTTVTTVM